MSYQIAWRNLATGAIGIGPKQFEEAAGQAMVQELNQDHASFEHVLFPSDGKAQFKSLAEPEAPKNVFDFRPRPAGPSETNSEPYETSPDHTAFEKDAKWDQL